jgi:hypothetical protein
MGGSQQQCGDGPARTNGRPPGVEQNASESLFCGVEQRVMLASVSPPCGLCS